MVETSPFTPCEVLRPLQFLDTYFSPQHYRLMQVPTLEIESALTMVQNIHYRHTLRRREIDYEMDELDRLLNDLDPLKDKVAEARSTTDDGDEVTEDPRSISLHSETETSTEMQHVLPSEATGSQVDQLANDNDDNNNDNNNDDDVDDDDDDHDRPDTEWAKMIKIKTEGSA